MANSDVSINLLSNVEGHFWTRIRDGLFNALIIFNYTTIAYLYSHDYLGFDVLKTYTIIYNAYNDYLNSSNLLIIYIVNLWK